MKASAAYLENLTTYKMSDLLNQASLVMVPSGYKEDIVYSQIPTTGAGDLSFTRASNGTRVNSAGLVEVCPWNLVQNSEQYSAGTWGLAFLSISTDSAVAPNGTTTADLLYPPSSQAYCYVSTTSFSVVAGQTYTQSVYLKRSGFRWGIVDNMAGSPGAWFDLLNGVVGTVASGCTAFIESVGNGWYRCSVSSVAQAGTNYADFRMSDTNGGSAVTANGSDGLLAWGFQLNIGSTAKPYFPTTDRLNVPRLTYQNGGGGCPSLLLEKQSTNLALYSEQFDNAGWSRDEVTNGANVTTSPDGTQNADTIVDNSTNGRHINYQSFSGDLSISRTLSVYAKQNSLRYLYLSVTNTADIHCYSAIFDLQSGTVSATKTNGDATLSASIQSVGNGWYRCIMSGTMTTGTANYFPLIGTSDRAGFTGSLTNNNAPEYIGSGQSLYVWGAQLEASSYVTSYIPTTSASATRVADACSKTGISSLIGQTEGVLFVDLNYLPHEAQSIFAIEDWVTNSTVIRILSDTSTSLGAQVFQGGNQYTATFNSAVVGQRYKCALAYKANDFAFYVNGTQVSTSSSGTVPTTSNVRFGAFITGQTMDGQINEAVLFKTRLTNAELASLTTI
jgi:hypothetical protein